MAKQRMMFFNGRDNNVNWGMLKALENDPDKMRAYRTACKNAEGWEKMQYRLKHNGSQAFCDAMYQRYRKQAWAIAQSACDPALGTD